jgi:hypothetical protein
MNIELRVHVEALDPTGISRAEKLTVLRGQMTLIRRRAETGIPVSVESLRRAEELARELELLEAAA